MTNRKTLNPRLLLRAAITSRAAAKRHRDDVAVSLTKADAVLASAQNERDRAQAGLSKAESDHAATIAKAISSGGVADITVTPVVKVAQAALDDAASRTRMAKAARDQIAAEVSQAETQVRDAETAVNAAAESVIIAEVEAACSLDRINAAVAELVATDDAVFGLDRLFGRCDTTTLPPRLKAIVERAQGLRIAIAYLRPPRPVLAPPPEQQMMRRLERYRERLTRDPETKLSDVPLPPIEIPRPPAGVNAIEQDRARGAQAWAAAVR